MLAKVGSSKIRAANKRIVVENKFLGSLSVQCDDENLIDSVIGDDGQMTNLQTVMEVVANNSETVRFVMNGAEVGLDAVKSSLTVIASCKATVKRFSGR